MSVAAISQRLRLPLGFVLGAAYLLFARPTMSMLPLGLALGVLGLGIRAWAAGHINKNNRLAVHGPYAFVRNPLYLGSFLLAVGFALLWTWWFVLVVIAFFVLIYAPTIKREQHRISELFPSEYPDFEANVPAFIPRLRPWRSDPQVHGSPTQFSMHWYLRHAEWQALAGFLAGVAWLMLRTRLGL